MIVNILANNGKERKEREKTGYHGAKSEDDIVTRRIKAKLRGEYVTKIFLEVDSPTRRVLEKSDEEFSRDTCDKRARRCRLQGALLSIYYLEPQISDIEQKILSCS